MAMRVPAKPTATPPQLGAVLRNLGATSQKPTTVLTDGAEGPRSLGEAASPGPTRHVLDWFHLSMRVQHVAQTIRSRPSMTEQDLRRGMIFAETDAEGQDRGHECDVRARSRQRRALELPPVSSHSVNTPRFETVSTLTAAPSRLS
jgi:hypothetical protein